MKIDINCRTAQGNHHQLLPTSAATALLPIPPPPPPPLPPSLLPTPSSVSQLKHEEYVGNNKRITIKNNNKNVRIIGNGNRLFVHINAGKLEVIGNSNRVNIMENCQGAKVKYIGNSGKICVCDNNETIESISNKIGIKYTGVNGSVRLLSRDEMLKKFSSSTDWLTASIRTSQCVPTASHTSPEAGDMMSRPNNMQSSTTMPHHSHHYNANNELQRSQDDLTNKFNRKYRKAFGGHENGVVMNNINLSLGDLVDVQHLNAVNNVVVGRWGIAHSNLVINADAS